MDERAKVALVRVRAVALERRIVTSSEAKSLSGQALDDPALCRARNLFPPWSAA